MKTRRSSMRRESDKTRMVIRTALSSSCKCCVWLDIMDSKSHEDIKEELSEDLMKAYQRITLRVPEIIGETPCIRSERTRCIVPQDAVIGEMGKLRSNMTLLQSPTSADESESQVWHFAGSIWLVDKETCFCEYDASKGKGGMMVLFDSEVIFGFLNKYPLLKHKIDLITRIQYNWLVNNW